MAKEILKCPSCNIYTLKEYHCNQKTITIKPAKFSPEDRYGFYRREFKKKIKNGQNIQHNN